MQEQLKHKFKKIILGLILLTNQIGSNIRQIPITLGCFAHSLWGP